MNLRKNGNAHGFGLEDDALRPLAEKAVGLRALFCGFLDPAHNETWVCLDGLGLRD